MANFRMQEKVASGEAIDVSKFQQDDNGNYIIPPEIFDEDRDYCDLSNEKWVLTIGRDIENPEAPILASTSPSMKFLRNPDYDCLWVR